MYVITLTTVDIEMYVVVRRGEYLLLSLSLPYATMKEETRERGGEKEGEKEGEGEKWGKCRGRETRRQGNAFIRSGGGGVCV